jgi:hypothetical protein
MSRAPAPSALRQFAAAAQAALKPQEVRQEDKQPAFSNEAIEGKELGAETFPP